MRGMIIAGGIGVVTLGGIQGLIIPGLVSLAAKFEYVITNSFGTPFHVGSLIFIFLLMGAIVYGIYFTRKETSTYVEHSVVIAACFDYWVLLFRVDHDSIKRQHSD